jgi:Ca2+-binding EF-hand superfamily protein
MLHQDGDGQQVALQDGQISRKEWKAGFRLLDMDGDGFITREELNVTIDIFKVLDIESYKMHWWKTWKKQASKGSSSHPAAGEDSGTTLTQIMNVCGNAHGAHAPQTHNIQHTHTLKHP